MQTKKNTKKSEETPKTAKITEYNFEGYDLNDTEQNALILKLDNYSQTDIAKRLKRTESHISEICNKPEFVRAYNDFKKTWLQKLLDARDEAVTIYLSILRGSPDAKLRASICEKILQLDKLNTESDDEPKPVKVQVIENN